MWEAFTGIGGNKPLRKSLPATSGSCFYDIRVMAYDYPIICSLAAENRLYPQRFFTAGRLELGRVVSLVIILGCGIICTNCC